MHSFNIAKVLEFACRERPAASFIHPGPKCGTTGPPGAVSSRWWGFCVVRRRFSVQRCARCHLGISASEMVMRAWDLVYHLNCFTCTTCSKMLTTGDHFGMKDSLVYCRLHFETLIQGEYQTHFNHADVVPHKGLGPANTLGLSYFNGVGTVQKGRPRKRKSPGPGAELAAYNAGKKTHLRVYNWVMWSFKDVFL